MKDIASYKKTLRRRMLRGAIFIAVYLLMGYISERLAGSPRSRYDLLPATERPTLNPWGLLPLTGLPFALYGFVNGVNALDDWVGLTRSIPAIRTKFPQLDIRDIPRLASFAIEEIGAYVYEDHLFLISDDVFYLEDLRRIEWLYAVPGYGRLIQSLILVISRDDKTRSYVLMPYSRETFLSPSQHWTKSQPNTERLLAWLNERYPRIQTGYTKEQQKEWLLGQPLWKKIWELSRIN